MKVNKEGRWFCNNSYPSSVLRAVEIILSAEISGIRYFLFFILFSLIIIDCFQYITGKYILQSLL